MINAEASSAAAKKLAAEVQALQRKLAGALQGQVAAATALQSQLDEALAERGQLREQLEEAGRKVIVHSFWVCVAAARDLSCLCVPAYMCGRHIFTTMLGRVAVRSSVRL